MDGPVAVQDGRFVFEGGLWWPLRSPDGRRPLARARWDSVCAGVLTTIGVLLLLLACFCVFVCGLAAMGSRPGDPPDPAATPPEVAMVRFFIASLILAVLGLLTVTAASTWQVAAFRMRLRGSGLQWAWTPPTDWPWLPLGFTPPRGWQPHPAWPPPPDDWRGWAVVPSRTWPALEDSDGTFGFDGALWWPLRTPDGRRTTVHPPWHPRAATAAARTGVAALAVALADLFFGSILALPVAGAAGWTVQVSTHPGLTAAAWLDGAVALVGGLLLAAARWWRRPRRSLRLRSGGLEWVWTPAPGWPTPSAGFVPEPGWRPDPSWPAPPPQWRGWSVSARP